jgi:adenosylmethionine-8-amino-7-oxononanoate aminotransferase
MTTNPAQFDVGQYLSEESLKRIVLDLKQMKAFIGKPLVITKADGVWYEDVNGKRYLDGISGIFVVK